MATCYLAAIGNGTQFFTPQGVVLVGGFLRTKIAGTSTDVQTFTDSTGTVPNANPIPLGSDGRPPQEIWGTSGTRLKFILTDSAGVSIPNATFDYIPLINDPSSGGGSTGSAEWTSTGFTPSPIDATRFSVTGNQTATYQPGRRVRASVTSGTIYGTITSSVFGALTTVTVSWDNGAVIDGGLSAVDVSFLNAVNGSVPSTIPYGLNNTPIGATSPNTGNFTTLTAATVTTPNLVLNGPFAGPRTASFGVGTSGNFTVPTGVTSICFTAAGGGGGGGSGSASPLYAGGGGGGGAYVFLSVMAVTSGQIIPYSVGAGGAGGNTGNAGVNGTATIFGAQTFAGGTGGAAASGGMVGGPGGNGGSFAFSGGTGGMGYIGAVSGGGGGSLGSGAPAVGGGFSASNAVAGVNAPVGGGGGCGAISNVQAGAGGGGVLFVQW
jgi:hypothetical protein